MLTLSVLTLEETKIFVSRNIVNSDYLLGIAFSLAVITVLFPDLVSLINSPMFGTNLTLQDQVVSKWVFIPDLKVLKYEVFNNYNFLWSNLKGLGMPLLGNGLQVAPMYPLTLICLLVPDPFFWNVFVIARWLILGVGSFLLAVRCFGLARIGGLLFVLTFAFAFYELRWLNHAFLNGIAGGVWYLFFLLTIVSNTRSANCFRRNTLHFIGLTISAYSRSRTS